MFLTASFGSYFPSSRPLGKAAGRVFPEGSCPHLESWLWSRLGRFSFECRSPTLPQGLKFLYLVWCKELTSAHFIVSIKITGVSLIPASSETSPSPQFMS